MSIINGIKKVHFVGIGGISLSALAKLMLLKGIKVSGSDLLYSPEIATLTQWGADVWVGHSPENIVDVSLVVYSSAVKEDDIELAFARENFIPTVERFVFLGEIAKSFAQTIAIAGTHGKTTTTGMLANVMRVADLGFAAHIGGYVLGGINNLIYSGDEYFLTEACEYKRSLLSLNPSIGVILNAEEDHPDTYSSLQDVYTTFDNFSKKSQKTIVNADSMYYKNNISAYAHMITYGSEESNNYSCTDVEEYENGYYRYLLVINKEPKCQITLQIPGFHNISNSLSVVAVGVNLGIDLDTIAKGISEYKGVARRFQKMGVVNKARVYIDYAHHPSEIKATLLTARKICKGKLKVVFQPHTFSRTFRLIAEFSTCFDLADELYIVKSYAAREEEKAGLSAYDLYLKLTEVEGIESLSYYEIILPLAKKLARYAKEGDMILILGAGDIDNLAQILV